VDENDGIVEDNKASKEFLVSIIMPAFNSVSTISDSIQSVLSQSYTNWELLIIDDHSKDTTIQVVQNFIAIDNRIQLLKLPKNGGLSNARNVGINASQGEFLTFLDADDLWHENKLEVQIELHKQNPSCRISHTNYDYLIDGEIKSRRLGQIFDFFYLKSGKLYPQILYKNNIAILSVMVERDLVVTCEGFDTSLWAFEDQDLWVKISKKTNGLGYLEEKLCYYRINPLGMSSTIGKYKRAHKHFLYKYTPELIQTNKWGVAQGVYFNYFGLQYYKRKEFNLALLYFAKAWKLKLFSVINLFYIGYLGMSFVKMKYLSKTK